MLILQWTHCYCFREDNGKTKNVFTAKFSAVINRSFYNRSIARQKRAQLRMSSDPFTTLTNAQFKRLFRFDKTMCRNVIALIKPHLTARGHSLGICRELQILCTLRFLATGLR